MYEKEQQKRKWIRDILIGLISSIISVYVVALLDLPIKKLFGEKMAKENIVLLGSGAVISYLGQYDKYTKNTYFLDGPSKTAFDILQGGRELHEKLQMIAMSSIRFKDNDIEKGLEKKIIEVELPVKNYYKMIITIPCKKEDKLEIFQNLAVKHIRLEEIIDSIRSNNYELYMPSKNSGTRIYYQELFRMSDPSFQWPTEIKVFDLKPNTIDEIRQSKKHCLILTSEFYKIMNLGQEYEVLDKNTRVSLSEPLYFYFLNKEDEMKIDENNVCNFSKDFKEGYFVEELYKKINPNYKFKLKSKLKDNIIKIIIE